MLHAESSLSASVLYIVNILCSALYYVIFQLGRSWMLRVSRITGPPGVSPTHRCRGRKRGTNISLIVSSEPSSTAPQRSCHTVRLRSAARAGTGFTSVSAKPLLQANYYFDWRRHRIVMIMDDSTKYFWVTTLGKGRKMESLRQSGEFTYEDCGDLAIHHSSLVVQCEHDLVCFYRENYKLWVAVT